MKNRPELDIMSVRSMINNGENLLSESVIKFLEFIENSTVLEIDGGLGLISEHLSATNRVRLCDDGRLYFVYRRQIFPKSSVIEMNISPTAISTKNPIVDYVVIHKPEFLDMAKKIAKKMVVLMYDMSVITSEVIENEKININNTEVTREISKDNNHKKSNRQK